MLDLPMTPKAEYWQMAKEAVGVMEAQQRPEELAMALTVVAETEPKIILEIGCGEGGTLYCWTQICPEVYGITLWNLAAESRDWHNARVLFNDSRRLESFSWIAENLAGRHIDVLFIDGDHSYETARSDFETYSTLVRDDGLILMHDVVNPYCPGLMRYWKELDKGYIISDAEIPELMIGFGVIEKDW